MAKKIKYILMMCIFSLVNLVIAHEGEDEFVRNNMMGQMMYGGYGSGWMFFGWLIFLLIIVVLILFIFWLAKQIQKK